MYRTRTLRGTPPPEPRQEEHDVDDSDGSEVSDADVNWFGVKVDEAKAQARELHEQVKVADMRVRQWTAINDKLREAHDATLRASSLNELSDNWAAEAERQARAALEAQREAQRSSAERDRASAAAAAARRAAATLRRALAQ